MFVAAQRWKATQVFINQDQLINYNTAEGGGGEISSMCTDVERFPRYK